MSRPRGISEWGSERSPGRHHSAASGPTEASCPCVNVSPTPMTLPESQASRRSPSAVETGVVARMALALTEWTERWVPDAFVFALLGTLIVVVAGVSLTPSSLMQVIDAWGRGFWELIPFTLQ